MPEQRIEAQDAVTVLREVELLPYVFTACSIVVTAVMGTLGHGTVRSAGPLLGVAGGYGVFARLDRSWALAVIGGAMGVAVGAVILADIDDACSLLLTVFGASMLAVGMAYRSRERR